jgi:hypothetical protein
MKIEQFKEALRKDDFAIGDSFWLGDFEFEVVGRKVAGKLLGRNEPAFAWELTREEFIQAIKDNHPEIKNAEEYFDQHEDKIMHYFANGFDALISDCGATYGTVMNDAIDEVIK